MLYLFNEIIYKMKYIYNYIINEIKYIYFIFKVSKDLAELKYAVGYTLFLYQGVIFYVLPYIIILTCLVIKFIYLITSFSNIMLIEDLVLFSHNESFGGEIPGDTGNQPTGDSNDPDFNQPQRDSSNPPISIPGNEDNIESERSNVISEENVIRTSNISDSTTEQVARVPNLLDYTTEQEDRVSNWLDSTTEQADRVPNLLDYVSEEPTDNPSNIVNPVVSDSLIIIFENPGDEPLPASCSQGAFGCIDCYYESPSEELLGCICRDTHFLTPKYPGEGGFCRVDADNTYMRDCCECNEWKVEIICYHCDCCFCSEDCANKHAEDQEACQDEIPWSDVRTDISSWSDVYRDKSEGESSSQPSVYIPNETSINMETTDMDVDEPSIASSISDLSLEDNKRDLDEMSDVQGESSPKVNESNNLSEQNKALEAQNESSKDNEQYFEEEESYGLDRLFNEENHTSEVQNESSTSNDQSFKEDESYGLDKLFDESPKGKERAISEDEIT